MVVRPLTHRVKRRDVERQRTSVDVRQRARLRSATKFSKVTASEKGGRRACTSDEARGFRLSVDPAMPYPRSTAILDPRLRLQMSRLQGVTAPLPAKKKLGLFKS